MLGGGMRQAGIIAAPGIIALEKMVQRLEEDHRNARFLAEELAKIDRIDIDLNTVQTNLVLFNIARLNLSAQDFVELLEKKGVKTGAYGKSLVRMAVHRGISKEDVKYTLAQVYEIVEHITK
jgi:threonine aldolase